jgi:alpha-L-rhamnosidase
MLSTWLSALLLAGYATAGPFPPTRLRVDHAPSPQGLVAHKPYFSFVLLHSDRAQNATEFEIIINRTHPNKLHEIAWSRIATEVPIQYNNDGKAQALAPDSEYVWAVRWKDSKNNQSGWSRIQKFTTGLFQDSEWRGAEWIGMDGPSKKSPYIDSDEYYRFRKTVGIQHGRGPVARCTIMIAGLGYYKLFVEGAVVDDHELGESTQFQERIPYDSHECTALVSRDSQHAHETSPAGTKAVQKNVTIAVELGKGWYGQRLIGALGNRPSGPRMLRFLMTLVYADGSTQYATSSSSVSGGWRRGKGPIVLENLHLGTVYDARRETPGWKLSCFDDSKWIEPRRIDFMGANSSEVDASFLANASLMTMLHPKIRKVRVVRLYKAPYMSR